MTLEVALGLLLAANAALALALALAFMRHHRAEGALRRLAMVDALTGLFNRRAFLQLAAGEIARARRADTPFAVLMMDLDWFKRVNDRYGHPVGDRVLAHFARTARTCLRAEDLFARYGGEEFCALLPGAGREEALAIAERIRARAAQRPLAGLREPTTVSIGISLYGGRSAPALQRAIADADAALYRAKGAGRNRVAVQPGARAARRAA